MSTLPLTHPAKPVDALVADMPLLHPPARVVTAGAKPKQAAGSNASSTPLEAMAMAGVSLVRVNALDQLCTHTGNTQTHAPPDEI